MLQPRRDSPQVQLGYCPQVDPLIDFMTAREHLRMFARLKGVGKHELERSINEVLERVTISDEMSRRPAGQYSGGNKRKLALGIALVGGVSAILLDEPSSGMVGFSKLEIGRALSRSLKEMSVF